MMPVSPAIAIDAKSGSLRGERISWPSAMSSESGALVTPASKKSPLTAAIRPAASAISVALAGVVSASPARAGLTVT